MHCLLKYSREIYARSSECISLKNAMRIINGLQPHTGQNYNLNHLTEFANKKYREFVQLIMPMRGPPFLPKLRKLGQNYQVLHLLEKYLNIQDCLENKICLEKYLKNTQKP